MENKLNQNHNDQKVYFVDQLANINNEWADVSYQHDECASISNGVCTIYFGADNDGGHPYVYASIEDTDTQEIGFFNTIQDAVESCLKVGK